MGFLRREGFWGSAFRLLVANVLAQGIGVASLPLITRLYTPTDFGELAIYLSLLGILAAIVAGRYELTIPLASEPKEAVNLAVLSLAIAFISSLGLGGLVWCFHLLYGGFLSDLLIQLLPIGLFLTAGQQTYTYWVSYNRDFAALTRVRVGQALIQAVLQIGLSFLGVLGLLLGATFGRGIGLASLLRNLLKSKRDIAPQTWPYLLGKYRAFPQYNLGAALLNAVSLQLVPLVFGFFFPRQEVGFFGLAQRALGLPVVLLGQAVAQVFYPEAARKRDDTKAFGDFFASSATVLLRIGAPLFGFVYLSGPPLFALAFGEEWRKAGEYGSYLAIWLLFNFVSSPLSSVPLIVGQQRATLFFTLYETVLRLTAVLPGAISNNPLLSVFLYSVVGAVISLIYMRWMFQLAHVNFLRWLKAQRAFLILFIASLAFVRLWLSFFTDIEKLLLAALIMVLLGLLGLVGLRR